MRDNGAAKLSEVAAKLFFDYNSNSTRSIGSERSCLGSPTAPEQIPADHERTPKGFAEP